MIFKGGRVFTGSGFSVLDVAVEQGVITKVCPELTGENIIDISGKYLVPGFVDIHTHGCVGKDFATASQGDIDRMSQYYLSQGVTTVMPTLVSLKPHQYRTQVPLICKNSGSGFVAAGLNLEGPFLSHDKRGAHNEQSITTVDPSLTAELLDIMGGRPVMMTVAPEAGDYTTLPTGLVLAFGHTGCSYSTALSGFNHGVRHITHLFNAMPTPHHRDVNITNLALELPFTKELICDMHHLHQSVIRTCFSSFPGEIVLVSDSISACGMGDGRYVLGGLDVTVSCGTARLADGTLAGSCASLGQCVAHCIRLGLPPHLVLAAATHTPASVIKAPHLGRISPGCVADLQVMSHNFTTIDVYKNGQLV